MGSDCESETKLTRAQRSMLCSASRVKGGEIRWGIRSNAGGALHRMAEKLCQMGLVEGPPYKITEAGRDAIAD